MPVFPSQSFTGNNVKVRWDERYTSEALNKKFLGIPRGVYAGFRPQTTPSSLVLSLTIEPGDGYSLVRVQSAAEAVMLDIVTQSTVSLDFTGHATWPVYVIASGNYTVGADSTGQIFTRQAPASGATEVNICKVDRPGNTGDLIVSPSQVFPTNDIVSRQEPYAFDDRVTLTLASVGIIPPVIGDIVSTGATTARVARVANDFSSVDVVLVTNGPIVPGAATFAPSGATANIVAVGAAVSTGQRFGFMPKGATEQLNVAYTTSQEVVASRTDETGSAATIFDPANPQTTGLPARLTQDLRTNSLASRLGLKTVNVRSNGYSLPGLTVDITLSSISGGAFAVGDQVQVTGNPTINGFVRNVIGSVVTVHTFQGQFLSGGLTDTTSGASGTIVSVVTNFLNVSGSLSAVKRGVLVNPPMADSSTITTLPSSGISVIGPCGTEDPTPGVGSNHPAVTGAITQTSINTVLLTVSAVQTGLGAFNSVDAFLAGEIITGGTSGAKAVVSELRFPYLVATAITGVTSAFTVGETVTGNITLATAKVGTATTALVTDTIRNVCFIKRTDTGERYTVPDTTTGLTNVVIGRLEFSVQDRITTSTLSFQNGSSNVNTSIDLRSLLDIGDILQAPDGRYYEVTTVTPTLLTIHQSYLGNNALNTPNVLRRRFKMFLKVRPVTTGIEASVSIPTSALATPLQFFFPAWLTEATSDYDSALLMMSTGEPTLPDATQNLLGKAYLAPALAPNPGTSAVMKIGTVANVSLNGTVVGNGNYHTINFITPATGITQASPGVLNVAATGPVGPVGPTGATGAPGAGGAPGGTGGSGSGFTQQTTTAIGPIVVLSTDNGGSGHGTSTAQSGSVTLNIPFTPKNWAVIASYQDNATGVNVSDSVWVEPAPSLSGNNVTVPVKCAAFDSNVDSRLYLYATAAG